MAKIKIKTPNVNENIQTYVNEDYASGTTLTVRSSAGFSNGNYIVVGEPGKEKTEVTKLTAAPPSNTTLTITALNFDHPKGTPVYYVEWDKYDLYYRTSSTGTWTQYGSMPASLYFDAAYTEYQDTSATSSYEWRYRYYSTENSAYSDYSDTIGSTGWAKDTVGYMISQIRKIANDPDGQTVSDTEIIRYLNAAQTKIYTLSNKWWFLLKDGTAIDTVASTKKYSLPSDFGRMDVVSYRYVNGDTDMTYNLRYKTRAEFDYITQDNNADDDDLQKFYTIYPGDSDNSTGYLEICSGSGGAPETAGLDIIPRYYKTITQLDSYGDATEVPIPEMLEDYAVAQILYIRKEDSKAKNFDKQFKEQIELLKLMNRQNVGTPRSLWEYRGRKINQRLFGTRGVNDQSTIEKFW